MAKPYEHIDVLYEQLRSQGHGILPFPIDLNGTERRNYAVKTIERLEDRLDDRLFCLPRDPFALDLFVSKRKGNARSHE